MCGCEICGVSRTFTILHFVHICGVSRTFTILHFVHQKNIELGNWACTAARAAAAAALQPLESVLKASAVQHTMMIAVSPPPWSFPHARVLYQPTFVPVAQALAVTPTDGLQLLSAAGYTLGGLFVVEWTNAPLGPYREVAVLSAVVSRGLSIGAWASHIFVDRPEAVEAGRTIFGLPAQLAEIRFEDAGESACRVHFQSESEIVVSGWRGWSPLAKQPVAADASLSGVLSLPSFSGRLSAIDTAGRGPLLRYPLSLGPIRRAGLRGAMCSQAAPLVADEHLRALIDGPQAACPCVVIDGVDVVAGAPSEVMPST